MNAEPTVFGKPLEHSKTRQVTPEIRPDNCSNGHSNGFRDSNGLGRHCGDLRDDPSLLKQIGEAITARGYAGDVTAPLLIYVVITSRLLDRPMNMIVLGESSVGKNATIEAALTLHPPQAVHRLSAASPRALIYDDEDVRHRHVYLGEADSIPDDGPAASAMRALITDNALRYSVVEQNRSTKKWETRRIEKPGPTGLITTATRSLPPQIGTRVLEIHLTDDPAQTRAVMRAHAHRVNGSVDIENSVSEPFISYQSWLAEHGERRVIVPFAEPLADLIPARAVRMRRDFPQLLTTIQTIAFLYQCQRSRAADGAVIATLDDYTHARRLLVAAFDTNATEGLTPAVRQCVEAVNPGETISLGTLAQRLGLAKNSASWRLSRAVKGGWLENMETRPGHEARIMQGAPLPDPITVLPTVESVQQLFESNSNRANGHWNGRSHTSPPENTKDANRSSVQVAFDSTSL